MDITGNKDRRVKREIANSNERRRMRSINAGFQKLKRLLPVNDGEKISKANILQNAADYVQKLHEQNALLRGLLLDIKSGKEVDFVLQNVDFDALANIPISSSSCSTADSTSSSTNRSTTSTTKASTTTKNKTNNAASNNGNSKKGSANHRKADQTSRQIASLPIAFDTTPIRGSTTACISELHVPATIAMQHATTTLTTTATTTATQTASLPARSSNGIAKAAIALPLEVPYTSETVIRQHHHHDMHSDTSPQLARKLLKTDQVTAIDSQDPAPKGQNLDTICKAIMKIEGDRVFKNEINK